DGSSLAPFSVRLVADQIVDEQGVNFEAPADGIEALGEQGHGLVMPGQHLRAPEQHLARLVEQDLGGLRILSRIPWKSSFGTETCILAGLVVHSPASPFRHAVERTTVQSPYASHPAAGPACRRDRRRAKAAVRRQRAP